MSENRSLLQAKSSLQVRFGAKALITAGESVLLVRERHRDGTPFWTLPGGGIKPGETQQEGLRRELLEELDCRITIDELAGYLWYAHQSRERTVSAYSVYTCTLASTPAACLHEGAFDCRWVHRDSFPANTVPQVRFLNPSA